MESTPYDKIVLWQDFRLNNSCNQVVGKLQNPPTKAAGSCTAGWKQVYCHLNPKEKYRNDEGSACNYIVTLILSYLGNNVCSGK